MPKFRKKPVVVEAVQFVGGNLDDIQGFAGDKFNAVDGIMTLEGFKPLPAGYWVIKGIAGEFYPCEPSIFDATYEPVEA